jgi:hypothetical protein
LKGKLLEERIRELPSSEYIMELQERLTLSFQIRKGPSALRSFSLSLSLSLPLFNYFVF